MEARSQAYEAVALATPVSSSCCLRHANNSERDGHADRQSRDWHRRRHARRGAVASQEAIASVNGHFGSAELLRVITRRAGRWAVDWASLLRNTFSWVCL